MGKYLLIRNEDYLVVEIRCFDTMQEAEKEFSDLYNEFDESELLGWDNDYFTYESKYGNIITYQLMTVGCEDE